MTDLGTGTPVGGRPTGGDTDVKGLLKDRKFQLAAAAVVGVGAVVFLIRRNATPGAQTAAAGAAGSRGYVQGGADTTGTDIASFLGSWGAQQNAAFQQYLSQLPANTPAAGEGVGRVPGLRDNSPLTWTDSIQVGWNRIAGATGYQIRNAQSPTQITTVGDVDAYQIRDLIHNGSYFWQIRAIGPNGMLGDWSDPLTTHTKN